jgi:hypothetical protein
MVSFGDKKACGAESEQSRSYTILTIPQQAEL